MLGACSEGDSRLLEVKALVFMSGAYFTLHFYRHQGGDPGYVALELTDAFRYPLGTRYCILVRAKCFSRTPAYGTRLH